MSKLDRNKALVQRFIEEVWSAGNLDALEELVAADHVADNRSVASGREGLRRLITKMRAAFPDFTATIDELIGEGDRVVALITARGTHKGEFNGIAATGKEIEVGSIDVYRVANDQLAEHVGRFDELGLLAQLGVAHDLSWRGS